MGNHESCKDWGDPFCRHAFDCNDGAKFKPKPAPMTDTKPSDVDGLIEALNDLVDCGCLEGKLECATRAATTLAAQQARIEAQSEALNRACMWLEGLNDLDFAEIAADGGITVGMVVQQEASFQAQRLRAALKEPS